MKSFLSIPVAAILASSALAGNMGPGPWANGAYYPGQLDGRYSASVYNDVSDQQRLVFTTNTSSSTNISVAITNSTGAVTSTTITNVLTSQRTNGVITPDVVSGVLGFGIRGGTPTTSSNFLATTSIQNQVDPAQNYFAIFVNGISYIGTTIANINDQAKRVAGVLANGSGASSVSNVLVEPPPGATWTPTVLTLSNLNVASGAFTAKLVSDKAVVRFKGNNTGTLSTWTPAPLNLRFSIDGMKTGN